LQTLPVAVTGVSGRLALPELALLRDELFDPSVDLGFVLHLEPPRRTRRYDAGKLLSCALEEMTETRRTTSEEARRVGDEIGVDWSRFSLEQFRFGMDVEFEHGSHDPQTDVTGDDPIVTGKIALAHMKEFADYYERLERMEEEAKRDWAAKGS
jgi:hypothetical protein